MFRKDVLNEQGAVIVLFAFSLVVLILFVGLAIDTARLGAAHQKQSRTTEYLALAAIEAYMDEPEVVGNRAATHDNKMDAAIVRAEEVGGFGPNIIQAAHQSHAQVMGAGDIIKIDDPASIPALTPDQAGAIMAGKWWFAEPEGGCDTTFSDPCPCDTLGNWIAQCFEPLSRAQIVAGDFVSALEVRLQTYQDNPVKTVFARIMPGLEEFPLFSRARSAIVPRHAVFAVDISRSVAGTTHNVPELGIDWSTVVPTPGLAALELRNGAGDTCSTLDQRPTPILRADIPGFTAKAYWDGQPLTPWNGLPDTRPSLPTLNLPTEHFKDDYACYDVDVALYDPSGPPAAVTDSFLVQTENALPRNTLGPEYYGPEPLTSILGGIHEGLLMLERLSVPGDQVMIVGFDQDILHQRVIGPTAPGDTDFDLLKDLTDVYNGNAVDFRNFLLTRTDRGFFPREESDTDLPAVLLTAYKELAQIPGSEAADSWIAIFSDAETNCGHFDGPPDDGTSFMTGTSTLTFDFINDDKFCNRDASDPPPPIMPPPASWYDDNRYAQHVKSMAEAATIVSGEPLDLPPAFVPIVERDIRIHSFVFGDYVQPHTLYLKGASGCMTDVEAREGDHPFTLSNSVSLGSWGSYTKHNGAHPYHFPSEFMYDLISKPTSGYFVAIRPPCNAAGFRPGVTQVQCDAGLIEDKLTDDCNTSGVAPGSVVTPSAVNASLVDGQGRLICDPKCRTVRQQIEDTIKELFKDNPFVLVEGL